MVAKIPIAGRRTGFRECQTTHRFQWLVIQKRNTKKDVTRWGAFLGHKKSLKLHKNACHTLEEIVHCTVWEIGHDCSDWGRVSFGVVSERRSIDSERASAATTWRRRILSLVRLEIEHGSRSSCGALVRVLNGWSLCLSHCNVSLFLTTCRIT